MAFTEIRAQLASTVAEAIAYGINLLVFISTIVLLITKRKKNRTTLILGAMTIIMFSLTTVHFAAVNEYTFQLFLTDKDAFESGGRNGNPLEVQSVSAEIINGFIGDSLVLWRAWGLYGRRLKAIAMPVIFWVSSLVTGIVSIYVTANPNLNSSATWDLIWATLVLATNTWTVGMFGLVYWRYRQEVIVVVGPRKATYRTILIFLVESGGLYCVTWFIMVLLIGLKTSGAHVIAQLASEFTSMYPMMIIVVVCLGLTHQDQLDEDASLPNVDKPQSTVRFQRPSRLSRDIGPDSAVHAISLAMLESSISSADNSQNNAMSSSKNISD